MKKNNPQVSYKQSQVFNPGGLPPGNLGIIDYSQISNIIPGADGLVKKSAEGYIVTKTGSLNNIPGKENEIDHNRFSIELYASPDIGLNRISAPDKAYDLVLKNAGSMQLSYMFGGRIKIEITESLSAKIGIQYLQVSEKIKFKDSAMINNSVSKNRYKNIGVPMLIGYRTNWPGDVRLSLNTGIIFNITSQYKGAIPTVSGGSVDIKNDNVYDRNVNIALYFSADLSKRINPKTDLFVEPWFNYRTKNMVDYAHLFNQKIHTAGVSFGLRYRLFKNAVE